jgi:hypothetical protein
LRFLSEMADKFLDYACERASGSSADQLFEADSDHMVGEATCAWCQVESAARVHHGLVESGIR